MQGGEWLRIDMVTEQTLSRIVVDSSGTVGDRMRGYAVYVSDDADNWGEAAATGGAADESGVTEIGFPQPVSGRYLIIEQTGSDEIAWWSVYEVEVYP